jgi:CelD/BcsL family acetyltransferase involved in cellulose biosynthesis
MDGGLRVRPAVSSATDDPDLPTSLRVVVARSLGEWRHRWDVVADKGASPTHSLRSWWLESATPGDALFLLVTAEHALLGGLALQEEKWNGTKRYRVLGDSMWPTYYDVVCEPTARSHVEKALSAWFKRARPYIVELRGLSADTSLTRILPAHLERRQGSPSYYAELGGGFADYLARLSSNLRKEIGKRRRQLDAAGYTLRRVDETQAERALSELQRLHLMQFGDTSSFLPFYPSFRTASEKALSSGELVLYEARDASGTTLAVDAWFVVRSRAFSFIGGRSPSAMPGTGVALLAHAIEELCEWGLAEIDLGGGFGDWKKRWAPSTRNQLKISGPVGLTARTLVGMRDAALSVRRALRRTNGQTP